MNLFIANNLTFTHRKKIPTQIVIQMYIFFEFTKRLASEAFELNLTVKKIINFRKKCEEKC